MAHLRYVLPVFALTACGGANNTAPAATPPSASLAVADAAAHKITHVLLLSVDGMHQGDLVRYVATHPHSRMAQLVHSGISYARDRLQAIGFVPRCAGAAHGRVGGDHRRVL